MTFHIYIRPFHSKPPPPPSFWQKSEKAVHGCTGKKSAKPPPPLSFWKFGRRGGGGLEWNGLIYLKWQVLIIKPCGNHIPFSELCTVKNRLWSNVLVSSNVHSDNGVTVIFLYLMRSGGLLLIIIQKHTQVFKKSSIGFDETEFFQFWDYIASWCETRQTAAQQNGDTKEATLQSLVKFVSDELITSLDTDPHLKNAKSIIFFFCFSLQKKELMWIVGILFKSPLPFSYKLVKGTVIPLNVLIFYDNVFL